MPTIFEVARHILQRYDSLPVYRLHKLAYFCQGWSLALTDEPLFANRIEAWPHGPVVVHLFAIQKQGYSFRLAQVDKFAKGELSAKQIELIDAVLAMYGDKSNDWMCNEILLSEPWQIARQDLAARERGAEEITLESMKQHFVQLALETLELA